MGHFCEQPEFQKMGLYYSSRRGQPCCNEKFGFSSAMELFGIDMDVAGYLFGADRYIYPDNSPSHVAQRMEDFANQLLTTSTLVH
jgi:hypothetical protein